MKKLLLLLVLAAFGLSPILAESQGLQKSAGQTVSAKATNHKAGHKKAKHKAHQRAKKANNRKHHHNR